MKTFTKQWQSFDAERHLSPMLESRIGLAGLQQLNQNERQIRSRRQLMSPKNKNLNPRVGGRLATYATLAGVALAAPAIPNADATIIYSGPVNIAIPSTTAGIYFNCVTGVFNTNPGLVPGWDVNLFGSTLLSTFNPAAPAGGVYVGDASGYFNLAPGTVIGPGPTTTYTSGNISPSTPLNFNSSNNIVGFRFQDESNGNQTEYGWMRISLSGTEGSQPRAIVEYACENTGQPILAGQVPEPSTMALLGVMAGGALGVRVWRRRRNATKKL
jgi:PEP-CTERM motif